MTAVIVGPLDVEQCGRTLDLVRSGVPDGAAAPSITMSGTISMRRLLVLVLTLAITGSALAAPAYACVPTHESITAQRHSCCETAIASPVGPCCIVTAPFQRLSSTETRIAAPDQTAAIPRSADAVFWCSRDHSGSVSPPILRSSAVPLYLQQFALLI